MTDSRKRNHSKETRVKQNDRYKKQELQTIRLQSKIKCGKIEDLHAFRRQRFNVNHAKSALFYLQCVAIESDTVMIYSSQLL